LGRALALPVTVLIVVAVLWLSGALTSLAKAFGRRIRAVKALGIELEFEFTEDAARGNRESVEHAFAEYRTLIDREFQRLARQERIADARLKLVEDFLNSQLALTAKGTTPPKCRCTIYVQDGLFSDALYQLIDYYPAKGGAGRVLSKRFGAVGATWRLERNKSYDVSPEADTLIVRWGMTSEEATAAAQGHQSFACFLLRETSASPVVGVLYLDSDEKDAFPKEGTSEWQALCDRVRHGAEQTGLTSRLTKLTLAISEKAPNLRLTGV
jgi:hypothetical protein